MIRRLDPSHWLAAGVLVAVSATSGSLWFQYGLGLVPCDLCWYQRVLMYPLVAVLGVGFLEERPAVSRTVLALSLPGVAVAGYHSWLQATASTCQVGAGCGAVLWRGPLGLTIPNLALLAFLLASLCVLAARRTADTTTPRRTP